MPRDILSPAAIIDETPAVLRRVSAPWLGVLWLGLVPLRLFQANFFYEAFRLGHDARFYGDHLQSLGWAVCAALVPALFVRAVFVRACLLGLQSSAPPGREALKLPAAAIVNSLYLGLLLETAFYALMWSYLPIPFLIYFAGLAAVTAQRSERPGIVRPLKDMLSAAANTKVAIGLLFIFSLAFIIAWLNFYTACRIGLWAAGGVSGWDLSRWEYLLRPVAGLVPAESLPRWLCLAGTSLIVEPFWLAALTVYVHRLKLRETGEDLRLRFERLREAQS